jgi:HEAT repeat protein
MSTRKRRRAMRLALIKEPVETVAEAAATEGLVKGINALLPCLYDIDEVVKWRAVSTIGILVDRLTGENIEASRVIIRRLMWNLNDESGGIGWGSAEAMAEIFSLNQRLASEYRHILFSYTRKGGNYLELPQLQRGVIWGIGRLAEVHPTLVHSSSVEIHPYLSSPDTAVRGLAARVAGLVQIEETARDLLRLTDDRGIFSLYNGTHIEKLSVSSAAEEALRRIMKAKIS